MAKEGYDVEWAKSRVKAMITAKAHIEAAQTAMMNYDDDPDNPDLLDEAQAHLVLALSLL